MSGDELTKEELDRRIGEHDRRIAQLIKRINELEDENDQLRECVQLLEQGSQSGKFAKFRDVVEYAWNKGSQSQRVKLTYSEVQGAAGVSARYAYELMDEMDAEYPHATLLDGGDRQDHAGRGDGEKVLAVKFDETPLEQQLEQLQQVVGGA